MTHRQEVTIRWPRNAELDGKAGLLLEEKKRTHCTECSRVLLGPRNLRVEIDGNVFLIPDHYILEP